MTTRSFAFESENLVAPKGKYLNYHHDCHTTWVKVTYEKQFADHSSTFKLLPNFQTLFDFSWAKNSKATNVDETPMSASQNFEISINVCVTKVNTIHLY